MKVETWWETRNNLKRSSEERVASATGLRDQRGVLRHMLLWFFEGHRFELDFEAVTRVQVERRAPLERLDPRIWSFSVEE